MSVIIWNRIEPDPRGQSADAGARAALYDPLWLVARQWQLGELTGSNGGSPITVEIKTETSALAELERGDERIPLHSEGPPLEALVERESGVEADLRLRGRGGRFFLDLLRAGDLEAYEATLREEYAFIVGPEPGPLLRRLRRRAPDGARIAAALADGTLVATLAVSTADQQAFETLVTKWRAWYAPRAGDDGATAWRPEHLEYAFELRVPVADGTVVLEAPEYRGGRLDWDAFRGRREPGPGAAPVEATHTALPTLVDFPGAGARRFWQLDADRLDSLSAGPGEIGRLLLVEFALSWAHDWFVAPMSTRAGALIRVASLIVTDTFGARTAIAPAHEALADDSFGLYRVSGTAGLDGALFVPPVLPAAIESAPFEEVAIVRDEGANLAWGIERVVPGETGRPLRARRRREGGTSTLAGTGSFVTYLPMTAVEPGWHALTVRRDAAGTRLLARAALVVPGPGVAPPRGALLAGAFAVLDDEVPREGLVLRRRWQLARAPDGSLHLWITRQREPAAGEVATGFAFDRIE
jgi:hypothetical protein